MWSILINFTRLDCWYFFFCIWMKNHQNLINSLDSWNKWTLKMIKFNVFIKIIVRNHGKLTKTIANFRFHQYLNTVFVTFTVLLFPRTCHHIPKKELHEFTEHFIIEKSVEPIFEFWYSYRVNSLFSCQTPNYEAEKVVIWTCKRVHVVGFTN